MGVIYVEGLIFKGSFLASDFLGMRCRVVFRFGVRREVVVF